MNHIIIYEVSMQPSWHEKSSSDPLISRLISLEVPPRWNMFPSASRIRVYSPRITRGTGCLNDGTSVKAARPTCGIERKRWIGTVKGEGPEPLKPEPLKRGPEPSKTERNR